MLNDKTIKTTKKQFEEFKSRFMKWADLFGLKGWRFFFAHKKLDDAYANAEWDIEGRCATIIYNSEFEEDDFNHCNPDESAFHEVIHILHGRLYSLAKRRFVTQSELDEAIEEITRIMESVVYPALKDKI